LFAVSRVTQTTAFELNRRTGTLSPIHCSYGSAGSSALPFVGENKESGQPSESLNSLKVSFSLMQASIESGIVSESESLCE
jgi:hypothetical protein